MSLHFSVIFDVFWPLFYGAQLSFFIAIFGLVGGMVLGVLAGLARAKGPKTLDMLAFAYIELIRGTPLLVQMLYLYYALPVFLGVVIDPIPAAIFAISINSGAYIGEIVRGAILSVDRGQIEAGKALGLSSFQVMTTVIGPVAFRRMIPALGNQFIISIKDTSLASVIAVAELTRQGMVTVATHFRALEIWTAVGLFYLVMTQVVAILLRILERRIRIP